MIDAGPYVIPDLWPVKACPALVARAEGAGFVPSPAGPRESDRAAFVAEDLAASLWAACLDRGVRVAGAQGLNPRLRFYRYGPDQGFAPHQDGAFRAHGRRSTHTLLLVVEAACLGGETVFPLRNLWIRPFVGLGLLFPHEALHEGRPIRTGRKVVLRTDVCVGDAA